MIVWNKYGFGYYKFEGTDKALVTFMRIERAINARGFEIDPISDTKTGSKGHYMWPGIGRVEIQKLDPKKDEYWVTYVSGKFITWFEWVWADN